MRNQLRSLLSPSMFVALLALVLAMSTASVAAVMINGNQIKKNTVSSAQIKNKTIKSKDLSPKTVSKLKGAAGPAGAAGAAGVTGPQGPTGPSNAYGVSNDTDTAMSALLKNVLTLNVPAGSYVVHSTAWALRSNNGGSAFATCELRINGAVKDQTGEELPNFPNAWGSLATQTLFASDAAAQVTLACSGNQSRVEWKKITATKVGSVSNAVGPNVP